MIAGVLRPGLRELVPRLRLVDVAPIDRLAPGETFLRGDLSSPDFAARAVKGVAAIVHLAAAPPGASFESLCGVNIVATFNLFEAARRFGVGRFVFASTIHVMGFYERAEPFDERSPVRPDSPYAASKVFGEALGRLYAEKHGIGVACLRIGGVKRDEFEAEPGNWMDPDDLLPLVRISLEHPDLRFEVFHALADYGDAPRRSAMDPRYGFAPRKAQESFAASQARAKYYWPTDLVAQARLGATFASQGYSVPPTPADVRPLG